MYSPCIAYASFSTDQPPFFRKHLLGVFDESEVIAPEAEVCGSASYFVGNELQKVGWTKVGGSGHDLEKDGLIVRIRHIPLLRQDGVTQDACWASLQQPKELLDKMLDLIHREVWK